MRDAAANLTPVVLELGGKDAAVVCDDCDFDQVVGLALRGTFQNCGQNCIGLERVVAHQKIYNKLVDVMSQKVNALSQGPPLDGDFDCGAMTMGPAQVCAVKRCNTNLAELVQIAGIQKLVDDAVANGARLLAGGKANTKYDTGAFYEPTLLVDVTPNMQIAQKEVFGPVMVIMKALDDEDALRIV